VSKTYVAVNYASYECGTKLGNFAVRQIETFVNWGCSLCLM